MAQKTQKPIQTMQINIQADPKPKIVQNHLSSSAQLILKYEERNFEIEDATNTIMLTKQMISNQIKEPFQPSKEKPQQLLKKYGSMIENQPMFLRELALNNYYSYLPEKFKLQLSEVVMLGGAFEAVWWGSLAFLLFRAYRNRKVEQKMKQKVSKGIGAGIVFVVTSLGFHNQIYIPKLKTCFYKNLRTIDSLMDKHVKILSTLGKNIDQLQKSSQQQKNQVLNTQRAVQNIEKVQNNSVGNKQPKSRKNK